MEATAKEKARTEEFLLSRKVKIEEIESFRFMQRHTPVPERHSKLNQYGHGLLTLQMASGEERVLTVHVRHHPTSIVRTLLSKKIPFGNYRSDRKAVAGEASGKAASTKSVYHRPSLYMFWYFVLFLTSMTLGFCLPQQYAGAYISSLPLFAVSLYCLYLLLSRFCYITLDETGMTVSGVGRTLRYKYDDLLKVNFDFAREQNFTHVMEFLDKEYRYHLFYIGRVSRHSLNEITERLCAQGIDATCSLNPEKRHYDDVYHNI